MDFGSRFTVFFFYIVFWGRPGKNQGFSAFSFPNKSRFFSTSSFPVSSSQHLHSNLATGKIMRFCFYLWYVLGVLLGKSDRFWKLVSILLPCLNGLRAVLLSVLDRLICGFRAGDLICGFCLLVVEDRHPQRVPKFLFHWLEEAWKKVPCLACWALARCTLFAWRRYKSW